MSSGSAGTTRPGQVEGVGDVFGDPIGTVHLGDPLGEGANVARWSTSWNASRSRRSEATWPTNRIMGVESWLATWTPAEASVASGPL